jgi:sec-independent protein translocase protein TatA
MGMGISPMEMAVIAIIALIVLGPNKLPEAARSVGKGFREMRDSFQGESHDDLDLDDVDEEEDDDVDDEGAGHGEETATPEQPSGAEAHQKDARSSVPSASSSSTERE